MIVSIGCDHAGPALKARISDHLAANGHELLNRGTDSLDSVDYPDHAHAVADDVGTGNAELGILICGSANGVSMTANKHQEVRAAIAWTPEVAALGRQHNDANVLCIPARFVSEETAMEMVDVFLASEFEGGRHGRRVGKIACALSLILVGMLGVLHAQGDSRLKEVTLEERQMKVHLSILASDGFEGRETGEPGQRRAAQYLEAYYASLGFEPCNNGSFFQNVPLVNTQIRGGQMMVLEDTLQLVEDVLVYPGLDLTEWEVENLTFVGYGIQSKQWNDYKKYKGGGVVMFLDGEPNDGSGSSLLTKVAKQVNGPMVFKGNAKWLKIWAQRRSLSF